MTTLLYQLLPFDSIGISLPYNLLFSQAEPITHMDEPNSFEQEEIRDFHVVYQKKIYRGP